MTEGQYPTPASSSILYGRRENPITSPLYYPVPKKNWEMSVKFTVQRCRTSKRLRSNHGTVEGFFFFFISQYFITTLLTAYLQQFLLSGTTCLAIDQFSSLSCIQLEHPRPLCPSPTPRVYSNSCPLSRWCHWAISSSVIPFSCLQSFPAPGSFQMSQFFTAGGQSIGVSASVSVLMLIQDWSPLGWTGWISLQSKGFKSLLQNHSSKASVLWCSAFFIV